MYWIRDEQRRKPVALFTSSGSSQSGYSIEVRPITWQLITFCLLSSNPDSSYLRVHHPPVDTRTSLFCFALRERPSEAELYARAHVMAKEFACKRIIRIQVNFVACVTSIVSNASQVIEMSEASPASYRR